MDALSQYDSLKSLPPPSPETLLLNSLFSEMLQMRAEMAALKARPEADESLKSAKEELAAARAEIAELKTLVRGLCVQTVMTANYAACGGVGAPRAFGERASDWLSSLSQPVRDLAHAALQEARATRRGDYAVGECTSCGQTRKLCSSCGTKCCDNCGK